MQVGMPLAGIGPEGVDDHYRTRHPFLHSDHHLQQDQQTFVSTAAENARQGAVVREIDPLQGNWSFRLNCAMLFLDNQLGFPIDNHMIQSI